MSPDSAETETEQPSRISHLVIEVPDSAAAARFYGEVLGAGAQEMDDWPQADETALTFASGQVLAFRSTNAEAGAAESGVHQAYVCTPAARAAIAERLKEADVEIQTYQEDRPTEAIEPFYFIDPFGNRVQLVAGPGEGGGITGIDHAAVQASDIEWEEEFFVERLGFPVDHRVGWNTADYVRARAWAEGKEDMAPGTRRIDRRYRDIPGAEPGQGREVARPNMQIFLGLKNGVVGIFLATSHRQEPPPEQAKGTPRTALTVSRPGLDAWAERLAETGVAMEGPVNHRKASPLAASLYFRDPCGNFFEFCTPAAGGLAS